MKLPEILYAIETTNPTKYRHSEWVGYCNLVRNSVEIFVMRKMWCAAHWGADWQDTDDSSADFEADFNRWLKEQRSEQHR